MVSLIIIGNLLERWEIMGSVKKKRKKKINHHRHRKNLKRTRHKRRHK